MRHVAAIAQQDGRRVVALELTINASDMASGILVMPFGLALDHGVALAVDDDVA